jgi:hypothetical protein
LGAGYYTGERMTRKDVRIEMDSEKMSVTTTERDGLFRRKEVTATTPFLKNPSGSAGSQSAS